MKKLQKGFVVTLLLVIIALIVIGGGVYIYKNKKVVDVTVKPESTLTLTANGTPGSITVNSGTPVTISWIGSNLNTSISGTGSGDWANQTKSCSNTTDLPFSPINTGSSATTKTYTLTCKGLNGVTVSSTVSVITNPTVVPTNSPSLTLKANGTAGSITISSGTPFTLSWTGSNLNTNISGTASGGTWYGTRSCANTTGTPVSIGNTSVGSVTWVYKLTCTGLNGATVSSTVSVTSTLAYVPSVIPTLILKVTDTSTNTVSSGTTATSGNTGGALTGGVATITVNSGDTIHLSSTGSNLNDLTHGFPDAGDATAWTNGGTTYKACPNSLTTPTDYSPDFLLTNTTSSPITNHYTLRCHYTNSLVIAISSKVDVTINPEPSLTLTANGTPGSISVNSGDPVTISWTGTNLNTNINGTASGAWGTGTKSCANTTGTPFSITNTNSTPITRTYTLTCTGLNSTTVSSTVSVTSNYVPPPTPTLTFYIKDTNTTTVASSTSDTPAVITINSGDSLHLYSRGSNLTQLAFGVPAGDDSTNWSTGSSYKTCPSSTTTSTEYSPDFSLTNATQSPIVKKYILRCHTTSDTSTYISREVDVTVNPEPI